MCRQCEDCIHAYYRAAKINCPVDDSYPAEYWCSVDEDEYFYCEDSEIELEMYYAFIEEQMAKGYTQEQAEELADEQEFEVECPSYSAADYYDYYPDEDPDAYDKWRDAQLEAEYEANHTD